MSVEIAQAVTDIEWIVAPEGPPLPVPVRTAIHATQNGRFGLKQLYITNPYTNEFVVATTMPDYNGETILEIIAPNGNSYWHMNGEHICGFHPEGSTYINSTSEWEQIQNNAFINPIWAGVR